MLANGKVLVAGGRSSTHVLASAELYDALSKTWAPTGDMKTARYLHTASVLTNGKVLVVGGSNGSQSFTATEMYDPIVGTWSDATPMKTPRINHTASVLTDGSVLVVGEYVEAAPANGVELFKGLPRVKNLFFFQSTQSY